MKTPLERVRNPKPATKRLLLGIAVLVVAAVASVSAQDASAAGVPAASNGWFLTALHAVDELLSVGLAATLAGLSITAATFASGTKSSTTAESERIFYGTVKDFEELEKVTNKLLGNSAADLPADRVVDLKKLMNNKMDAQEHSDKSESMADNMLGFLVNSFFFFIAALFVIFVGDTFVGKHLPYVGVVFLLIENLPAGILMFTGIIFLAKGANQIREMKVSKESRVVMLKEAFPMINTILDLPEPKKDKSSH